MREIIGIIDLRLVHKHAVATVQVTYVEAILCGENLGMAARDRCIIQYNIVLQVSPKCVSLVTIKRNHLWCGVLSHENKRWRISWRTQDGCGNTT